jgi:hypothetical protein
MLALMLGTVALAVTYGAFWHNQPARRQNDERGDQAFRLGRPANRALEWLLLMPHISNPLERKKRVLLTEKGVIPAKQTEFFRPVLRALHRLNPRRRILVDGAAMELSIPADLFKSKANTNALAAGRTT